MRAGRWLLVAACLAALCVPGCAKRQATPPTQTEVQEFYSALREGDATIVDRLLSAKPALANTPGDTGETPLAVAQKQGNQELVDVLKRHGAH